MHVFEHVTDYGPEGMAQVLPTQLVAARTTLWGPSRAYLDAAHEQGHYPLDAMEVLDLVREDKLVIIGREWWLTDPEQRNRFAQDHPWARWDDRFDGELCDLALAQRQQFADARDRAVVIASEEPGTKFAQTVLDDPDADERDAWLELADMLLEEGRHGPALAEKLRRAPKTPTEQRRVILRDIKNHKEAVRESKATTPIIDSEDADLYALGVMPPVQESYPDAVDAQALTSLLSLISAFTHSMDGKQLRKLLRSDILDEARREAQPLLLPGKVASRELRHALEPHAREIPWSDVLLGGPETDRKVQVGGLLLTLASAVNPQNAIVTFASLATALTPSAKAGLRKAHVMRPTYTGGMVLPFLAARKAGKPTYAELAEVLEFLKDWDTPAPLD